jgi:uncharacterized membrane protein
MSYGRTFGRLLLYSIPAAPLAYLPTALTTALLMDYIPSIATFMFAPIAGPLFSIPALLIAAYVCKHLTQRPVRNIWLYTFCGAVISAAVTGTILFMFFKTGLAHAYLQSLYAGAIVGLLFGWYVKNKPVVLAG